MSYHKRTDVSKQQKRASEKTQAPAPAVATQPANSALSRALRQIADGKYRKALDLLRSAGSDLQVQNAIGVCLLRLDRIEDANLLFRKLVLAPGCTWMRPNVPTIYKTNFATALLMSGQPSGCEEILADLGDPSHPSVQRLSKAIDQWVNSLTFWQKLNWWVGRIEPKTCHVHLDFVPGELEVDVVLRRDQQPTVPDATDKTAA